MSEPRDKPTLTAIWETVPDADAEALQKAVAMLFRRGPYRRDSSKRCQKTAELDKSC